MNHKPSDDENFYVAFVNEQVTSIDEKQVFLIDPDFTLISQFSRIWNNVFDYLSPASPVFLWKTMLGFVQQYFE